MNMYIFFALSVCDTKKFFGFYFPYMYSLCFTCVCSMWSEKKLHNHSFLTLYIFFFATSEFAYAMQYDETWKNKVICTFHTYSS